MHLGLYPIGLLSTSSSWEGKRQMYWWSPKWDGTKDNNLSRDEKVLFKELCFDGVLFWSFRASCYPCMPSNPLLFFFYFFLPQGLLWLFFVTKFNCPPFLSAALHHKPHGTFLGLCDLQKPTAPLFLWSGRCKALEPRFFFYYCVEEKASRLFPFVTFSACTSSLDFLTAVVQPAITSKSENIIFLPCGVFCESPTTQKVWLLAGVATEIQKEIGSADCGAQGTSAPAEAPHISVWC